MMTKLMALISVYHKDGIVEFAHALIELGFEIVSTGGTARHLRQAGLPVTDVSALTGYEPSLGDLVKTLTPQVHGALLAKLDDLDRVGFPWIDLVCVDLYPLKAAVANPDSTEESVIEKTDIGGPTMLRSGAKGRRIVVADPADRDRVLKLLESGGVSDDQRRVLAAKAEGIVAGYCLTSARYLSNGAIDGLVGTRLVECKGENGWQSPAGLYVTDEDHPLAVHRFQMLEGDAPSYNNLCDLDRMIQTMTHITAGYSLNFSYVPCIAIGVKHGNCCGAAVGDSPEEVIKNMISGDPLALFGGLVMTNFGVDATGAILLSNYRMEDGQRRVLDGVIAPAITSDARDHLARKQGRCRMLINPALYDQAEALPSVRRIRPVLGGFLVQPNYTFVLNTTSSSLFTSGAEEWSWSLVLAWAIGSTSNSNTITLVQNGALIGNGNGQHDRVMAAQLAVMKAERAGHSIKGAVAYSDSFFPFPDGPELLAKAGVRAILTSSGSVNDKLTKEVCKKYGVDLFMVPDSEGRGFFGH